jgi:hypothetical protein
MSSVHNRFPQQPAQTFHLICPQKFDNSDNLIDTTIIHKHIYTFSQHQSPEHATCQMVIAHTFLLRNIRLVPLFILQGREEIIKH